MNFDNDLMLFFRTIYEDSADMDECSAKVKSAVAAVADKLDIVRAELAVKMPATKLCEDGADMLMVLYDGEKDVENEPFEASFPLFEGGFITVTFYSGNSNGFDNEQRNIVEIIANTVFIQFNRVGACYSCYKNGYRNGCSNFRRFDKLRRYAYSAKQDRGFQYNLFQYT